MQLRVLMDVAAAKGLGYSLEYVTEMKGLSPISEIPPGAPLFLDTRRSKRATDHNSAWRSSRIENPLSQKVQKHPLSNSYFESEATKNISAMIIYPSLLPVFEN